MDDLQAENPKVYWQLINSLKEDDQNDKVKSIYASDWFDYFKDLNAVPDRYKNRLNELDSQLNGMNKSKTFCELDYRITTKEISECIRKLKSGSSSGWH